MQSIFIKTGHKEEIIDVTNEIEKAISSKNGICCIFLKHSTAALFINEKENGLKKDFLELFSHMVLDDESWSHDEIDDNASAHMKSALLGQSLFIPISDSKLQLGAWQKILLAEFDGPREREIIVKIL